MPDLEQPRRADGRECVRPQRAGESRLRSNDAFVGSPIAYVVEAILLLALGVRPPPGWRGLATTVAIGMLSGALTLGALAHFSEHVIGEGLAWFSGAGAVIGGSAACLYVLIVEGLPRARPAMRGSIG